MISSRSRTRLPSDRVNWFWLGGVLALGMGIRLYQISPALLELIPNRQLIDAELARAIYERGFRNAGLHLFGFPLYHMILAFLYSLWGGVVEEAGRILSVAASLGAGVAFWALLRLFGSQRQALLGLIFFYLLSPVHIIISRSFLVDELTLFMGILSLYFLARYTSFLLKQKLPIISSTSLLDYAGSGKRRLLWFWAGTVMMALTLLSKFTFGYLLLPSLWWVTQKKNGRWSREGIFLLLTILPVMVWSFYTKYANEQLIGGQPTGEWNVFYVFNLGNLVDPIFWINIFYHFARYAVTFTWLPLVVIGLWMGWRQKNLKPFYLWLAGAVLFILSFNIPAKTHSYYFLGMVPAAAFFGALATEQLIILVETRLKKKVLLMTGLLFIGLASIVTDEFIRAYRTYPPYQRIPEVAQIVRELTTEDDQVLTSANRTEAILYFAHREGWELRLGPLSDSEAIAELEKWRRLGADYYVIYDDMELVTKPEFRLYVETYPLVLAEGATKIYKL